jgi:hypothetical protein
MNAMNLKGWTTAVLVLGFHITVSADVTGRLVNEVEEELEGAVGRVALIWGYGEERRREDVVWSECECEKGERRREDVVRSEYECEKGEMRRKKEVERKKKGRRRGGEVKRMN